MAEEHVRDGIGEVDRLSSLPESLICEILLNLPTKDVVKTCVLPSRWRNLWKYVPSLDLDCHDFPNAKVFAGFVDSFLGFNSESCLLNFKVENYSYASDEDFDTDSPGRWINTVIKRKVQNLHVLEKLCVYTCVVPIPSTVYICKSLVSLKLCNVILPNPEFVSLPFLKDIHLQRVKFANNLAFEMLILGCPVLEELYLWRRPSYNVDVLRVCSKSLLSFTLFGYIDHKDMVVAIDAPMLKYLKLCDKETASFIMDNMGSLVKLDINIVFHLEYGKMPDPTNLPKINMIRNFFLAISGVKEIIISSDSLEVIYNYLRCRSLPVFHNLSSMRATAYQSKMLPEFLKSFPNLKSLVLGYSRDYWKSKAIDILPEHRYSLSSLEYVELERLGEPMDMNLASYFLENSPILKKLTIHLDDFRKKEASVILKELRTIPRHSSSCQLVVL